MSGHAGFTQNFTQLNPLVSRSIQSDTIRKKKKNHPVLIQIKSTYVEHLALVVAVNYIFV